MYLSQNPKPFAHADEAAGSVASRSNDPLGPSCVEKVENVAWSELAQKRADR
jgi:hypothetical protein